MITEVERLKSNFAGEAPDGLYWIYDVQSEKAQDDLLARITEVVGPIAQSSPQDWPSDDGWRALLPKWFLDSFAVRTREEAQHLLLTTPKENWSKLPWEFGSWLDAIHDRGWKWWSSKKGMDLLRICLTIDEWPASLEAFENIIRAAGGEPISRTQWQSP